MTIKQSNTRQVLGTPPNTSSPYAAAVRTFTPCCHFTGEQSEVLNASFCLRTHSPELHVAKAHHLPPKGAKWEVSRPLEEHIDQVQGPGKICPLRPGPSPTQAAWGAMPACTGSAVRLAESTSCHTAYLSPGPGASASTSGSGLGNRRVLFERPHPR